jgi:hypothetical protein
VGAHRGQGGLPVAQGRGHADGGSEAAVSAEDRKVISVSGPVYDRLAAIRAQRQAALKRQVSMAEVIEQLLERAEGLALLAAHAKGVERP